MTTHSPAQEGAAALTTLAPRRHVLDLDDFSATEIVSVLDAAEVMREVLDRDIKKVPSLRGKVIMTVFLEASTRTRVSFEQAGKILSADVINIAGSGSSAEKGESLLNTALTLQAMRADLLIVRSPHSGAPYFLARNLTRTAVVNAGDGRHAHPSQALLDLLTMRRHLGELRGRKVVIVGDVLHSRVARSDIFGLRAVGADVILSGPPTLMPLDLLRRSAPKPFVRSGPGDPVSPQAISAVRPEPPHTVRPEPVEGGRDVPAYQDVAIEPNLDKAIEGADVVMALRIQKERMEGGMLPSLREYTRRWMISPERMRRAKPDALLMHPGPMNEGVEISSSLAHSGQAQIEEQVTNGVAVRMALLYQLLTGQGREALS